MTREELMKKINKVEAEIDYEECADRHYRYNKVANLKATLKELKEALKELD